MNDQERYQRWQSLFGEIFNDVDKGIDPRTIYGKSRPTFFRNKFTRVAGTDSLELGLSRLEWLPDLPRGIPWPEYNGRAMDFLAQINLSDLEPGFHPLLPERGWLYFFLGEFWDVRIIEHGVLYFDGTVTDLERVYPPGHLNPPERLSNETALIGFDAGFSVEPEFLDSMQPWSFGHDAANEKYAPLWEPLVKRCQGEITRLGGYPYSFQGGGQDNDARLYLSGFEAMVRHGYFDVGPLFRDEASRDKYYQKRYDTIVQAGDLERMEAEIERFKPIKDNFKQHLDATEMLFGLESAMGRCWGDLGFLEFFIREEDLKRRDFSRAYCDVIST